MNALFKTNDETKGRICDRSTNYTQKCAFLNHISGEIPRSVVIDLETINPHELCYQCSKHGPDFY